MFVTDEVGTLFSVLVIVNELPIHPSSDFHVIAALTLMIENIDTIATTSIKLKTCKLNIFFIFLSSPSILLQYNYISFIRVEQEKSVHLVHFTYYNVSSLITGCFFLKFIKANIPPAAIAIKIAYGRIVSITPVGVVSSQLLVNATVVDPDARV